MAGAVGCVAEPVDRADGDPPSASSAIVGGRLEEGYPAAGYLMRGADATHLQGPRCGATLVAPKVALTAGHCVANHPPTSAYGVGFGPRGSSPIHRVARAVAHPEYVVDAITKRHRHDVAVLLLEDEPPVAPARVVAPVVGLPARHIGYGRITPGDHGVTTGFTSERKSTAVAITRLGASFFFGHGVDGGLCWGDSGGAVMSEGSDEVIGLLSDFDRVFDCHVGNRMVFTSLVGEAEFINGVTTSAGLGSVVP